MVRHLMGPWTDNKLEEAAIGLLAFFSSFTKIARRRLHSKRTASVGLQDKGQVVFEKRQKNSVTSEVQVFSIGLNFDERVPTA